MILPAVLALILAIAPEDAPEPAPPVASAPTPAPEPEKRPCIPVTGLYLPEAERSPAPNIRLTDLQYASPDDPCGYKMPQKLLMAAHERIAPIAAASFSTSETDFGVMVRLTLTPEARPVFEMRVSAELESEKEKFAIFYKEASAIADLHSTHGVVYVVMRYVISPAALAR